MKKYIKAFAPASISNIACGFDILGFAIENPGDEIELFLTDKNKVEILEITGDGNKLPLEVEKNTAAFAIYSMLKSLNLNIGVAIKLHKKMPLGSGLGSSAASAVVAVFALNELLETKLSKLQLLEFALKGEELASGAIHADNVAPCLYGNLTLIRGYNPVDVIELNLPKDIYCTVIYSDVEIKTIEARKILPKEIPLKQAITQWGNVGGLVAGFLTGDFNLISRSMEDVIIEPVRKSLIPGYDEIKKTALNAGALGCNISGSGPSVFALSNTLEKADFIATEMKQAVDKIGIKNTTYVSKIGNNTPKILEVE